VTEQEANNSSSPDEVVVTGADVDNDYTLRIARRTVDKLGVKLYDRVSAVVAELIANSYDADAELVTVSVPLRRTLAKRRDDGSIEDRGFVVEVVDTGHGMSPDEAQAHYLRVGTDRRKNPEQGSRSRAKDRPVMGRKGIGKLAPFGVCRHIEVISAGGPETELGFRISHFFLDYDRIISDDEEPVTLERGDQDRTYRADSGTTIRLSEFLPKRVPDGETLSRQIARRFGPTLTLPDFEVIVYDMEEDGEEPTKIGALSIPLMEETKIDLTDRAVITEGGAQLQVSGWLAFAKDAYKNEEETGIAIYARGKIVATTRDFEQKSGYTGEFMTRSYLVGEIHADWLDDDDGEDLIRTDRQGILWDSELGRALRSWGADLIKEVAKRGKAPRRTKVSAMFISLSRIEQRAKDRYSDPEIVETALDLARQIGAFAAEDELEDEDYVYDLGEIILSVAPHRALIEAFRKFSAESLGRPPTLDELLTLSGKTYVAELASYAQVAAQRMRVIGELGEAIKGQLDESELQELLARNAWLIEPTWSPITKNQQLGTVRDKLQDYLSERSIPATLAIDHKTKRPDFTLVSVGRMLHIVEIKAPGHVFNNDDCRRLVNYADAFKTFFEANRELKAAFPDGWRIDLIADDTKLTEPALKLAYDGLEGADHLQRSTWTDFLIRTRVAHEQFLEIREAAQELEEPEEESGDEEGAP